jgi:hypothetical protein
MYFIIYPNNSSFMKQRILKLSDTYNSSFKMDRFELGRTKEEMLIQQKECKNNITNIYNVLQVTTDNFRGYLIKAQ